MRGMLGEVHAKASVMLKEHKKQGRLFTIDPTTQPAGSVAAKEVPGGQPALGGSSIGTEEAMTAPMMALSLLSNTNFLIDQGLHSLALPRLPLLYPDNRAAQDECMERVDAVRCSPSVAFCVAPPQLCCLLTAQRECMERCSSCAACRRCVLPLRGAG